MHEPGCPNCLDGDSSCPCGPVLPSQDVGRNLLTVSRLREIIVDRGMVTVEPMSIDYTNDRVHADTSLGVYHGDRLQGILMTPQWSCGGCGNPIQLDSSICHHCGHDHNA